MSDFGYTDLEALGPQELRPAKSPYGYDALDPLPAANSNLLNALGANPDQQAKALRISKQTGVPFPAIENDIDHWEAQASLAYNQTALEASPKTASWVANNPLAARLAQDDFDNLTAIEKAVQFLGASGKALASAEAATNEGLWGLGRAAAEVVGVNPVSKFMARQASVAEARKKSLMPQGSEDVVSSGWYSGLQSLGQNLLTLPLAVFGGEGLGLLSMVLPVGGQAYNEARNKGVSIPESLAFGASQTAIEYATEKLPMGLLLKDLKAGTPFFKTLMHNMASEVPGEQLATLLQDMNEWVVLHPEQPFSAYIAERPSAAAQTLIATMVGVGGQVGTVKGIETVVDRATGRNLRSDQAMEDAGLLERLNQLAAASKVRERSVETFREFIAEATQDGPVPDLYIDPRALAQSGITPEELSALAPSMTGQESLGTDIRISTEDFAANIAGTPIAEKLLPHLKTEADGMSQAEAEEWMKTSGEQLKAEVAQALEVQSATEAFTASRDAVQADILRQLTEAKRFTDDVNKPYSALVAARYGVLANQLGTTPEDVYARFPLKIQAQSPVGNVLSQGEQSPEFKAWFGDSKVVDADGKPMVVYHGSMADITTFDPNRAGESGLSSARRGVEFTDAPDVASHYAGDSSTAAEGSDMGAVYPTYLSIKAPLVITPEMHKGNYGVAHAYANEIDALRNGDISADSLRAYGSDSRLVDAEMLADVWEASPAGIDGIIIKGARWDDFTTGKNTQYIVFRPEQIKSVNNRGTFDPTDPNILAQSVAGPTLEQDGASTNENAAANEAAIKAANYEFYEKRRVQNIRDEFVRENDIHDTVDGREIDREGIELDEDGEITEAGLKELDERVRRAIEEAVSATAGVIASLDDIDYYGTPEQARAAATAWLDANGVRWDRIGSAGSLYIEITAPEGSTKYEDGETLKLRFSNHSNQSRGHTSTEWNWVEGGKGEPLSNMLDAAVRFSRGETGLGERYHRQGQRGTFSPDTNTVTILKSADLSTFLHETGHAFLEMQRHFASLPNAPQAVVDDMNVLLDWFGVKPEPSASALEVWNRMTLDEQRASHEKFARGFELYLFEGRAPNVELQGIFQRFRAWLLNVYHAFKNLNVELTPEVRGVMDRMIATSREIETAQAARSMGMLFKTQAEAEQFGVDWGKYQSTGAAATEQAIDDLTARSLRDMKWLENAKSRKLKELQKEASEKRAEIRRDVQGEIMAQPIYRAWAFLTGKGGEVVPGTQAVGNIDTTQQSGKLRTSAVKEISPESFSLLSERRMTSENSGIHPDIVAELFGFDSGSALINALTTNSAPKVLIDSITDQRMLEKYGDITSPEAMNQAADEAIHNDIRTRMVATELSALEKASGQKKTVRQAAKQFAEELIARQRIRDIRPEVYKASAAKAANLSEKALKAGDLKTAANEKRNQLVNTYAAKAAQDAKNEAAKALTYFGKFDSASIRKSVDPAYVDQIDVLRERYEFKPVSNKALDKRASLKAWVESLPDGVEPEIPPEILDGLDRRNYRELTVEELRGLVDTAKQIEHLGRLKNRILTDRAQREYTSVRDGIVSSILANAGGKKIDTHTPNTILGEKKLGLKGFWAAHIKAATWARILDGGKDGGPVWESLIRTANEAGDKETGMREKATRELTALVAPVLKQGKMGGKGTFFPSIGRSLNREARLAIALNMGNEGNMQRLLGGEGWTLDQLKPVMDTLTKQDWTFVQSVWDYFESYRPEIAAKERRVYGKEPNWVDPMPVVTKHGTFKGGYYPIKYDPRASSRAEEHADAEFAKQQLKGAYTSATTRRSFTKTRVKEVSGRPLMYSLDGMYSGVNEVIHDLSWHEWLIDANRLLRSDSISSAIRETQGPEVHQQFKSWVQDIASEAGASRAGEKALAWIRQGVSISGLGLNVVSAMVQPFGITQSIVRIGPQWVGRGIQKFISNPLSLVDEIDSKSEFMRTRYLTRMRELNELRARVKGASEARRAVDAASYWLMLRAQQMVDVPTWWGAYEKAIAAGNDDARSAALADQAVIDAQGSGMTKDLAAIERGGPALKLFTVFYSFQNTSLNLGVAQAKTNKNIAKTAADMLLIYTVPVILISAMKQALTPGGGDDDWEEIARKMAGEQLSFLFGLMFGVREAAGAVQALTGTETYNVDYQGPVGLRPITDAVKLAKQINQGEMDDGLRKAIITTAGELLRLPAAQINRSVTGTEALVEGKTENPLAPLLGYQEPR